MYNQLFLNLLPNDMMKDIKCYFKTSANSSEVNSLSTEAAFLATKKEFQIAENPSVVDSIAANEHDICVHYLTNQRI